MSKTMKPCLHLEILYLHLPLLQAGPASMHMALSNPQHVSSGLVCKGPALLNLQPCYILCGALNTYKKIYIYKIMHFNAAAIYFQQWQL